MGSVSRRRFVGTGAAAAAGLSLGRIPVAAASPVPPGARATRPAVIASANGLRGVARAYDLLTKGADPLDAAIAGVNIQELDPEDQSVGLGGLPNADGVVQLDASCMHGPTRRAGAVASLEGIATPSLVAKAVMDYTDHILLVGPGAKQFALQMGFKEQNLLTEKSRQDWLRWKARLNPNDNWLDHDDDIAIKFATGTINMNAVTASGDIGSVTTTSGLSWKIPGRVGDSPIIGAGQYCDNTVGAAGSTGRGEANIKACGAFLTVEGMRAGLDAAAGMSEDVGTRGGDDRAAAARRAWPSALRPELLRRSRRMDRTARRASTRAADSRSRMPRVRGSRMPPSCSSGRSARGGRHVSSRVVFWDVDTQHDFMDASGKLYVPDAESIKPNLKRLTDYAHERGIRIVATADDHEPGHRELSATPDFRETFPEHCMRGTPGASKIPETALAAPVVVEPSPTPREQLTRLLHTRDGDVLIRKHWFDVFTNPNADIVIDALAPTRRGRVRRRARRVQSLCDRGAARARRGAAERGGRCDEANPRRGRGGTARLLATARRAARDDRSGGDGGGGLLRATCRSATSPRAERPPRAAAPAPPADFSRRLVL